MLLQIFLDQANEAIAAIVIEAIAVALITFNLLYFTQYDYLKKINRSLPSDLCKPPYHESPKSEFPESEVELCDQGDCGWTSSDTTGTHKGQGAKLAKLAKSANSASSASILTNLIGSEFNKAREDEEEKDETDEKSTNNAFYNINKHGFPYKHIFTDNMSDCAPPFPTVCGDCKSMFDIKWLLAYYLSWYMESCAFSFAIMRLLLKKIFKVLNLCHNDQETDTSFKELNSTDKKKKMSTAGKSCIVNLKIFLSYGFLMLMKKPLISLVPILSILLVNIGGFFTLSYGWILGFIFFFTGISSFWGLIVSVGQMLFLDIYLMLFMFLRKSNRKDFLKQKKYIFFRNIALSITLSIVIILFNNSDVFSDIVKYILIGIGVLGYLAANLFYYKHLSEIK
jgi:hypothetical protein